MLHSGIARSSTPQFTSCPDSLNRLTCKGTPHTGPDIATKPNLEQPITDPAAGIDLSAATREERARLVAKLFQEHNRALVSFLRAKLHNDAEAREVAQEAYVKLLQLESPGVVGFLQAYLFKIAANLAIDRIRRQAVGDRLLEEGALLFDEVDAAASPERICFGRRDLERISKAMDHLPEKCREAFVMHVLLERPIKDVAAELDISTRMVGYYLADAMEVCRRARKDIAEDCS